MPYKTEVSVKVGDIVKIHSVETSFSGIYMILAVKEQNGISIYNVQDMKFPDSFWTFFSDDDIIEVLA